MLVREAPVVYRVFFAGGNQGLCHSLVADAVSKQPRQFFLQEGVAPCSLTNLLVGGDIEDEAVVLCSHSKLIHLGISQLVYPDQSLIQGKVRVCKRGVGGGGRGAKQRCAANIYGMDVNVMNNDYTLLHIASLLSTPFLTTRSLAASFIRRRDSPVAISTTAKRTLEPLARPR